MKIIPSRAVGEALLKLGLTEAQMFPRDAEVALLARAGVVDFGRRFAAWLWRSGMETYAAERWDCDEYAGAAHLFAKLDHALWRTEEAGLAFGEVWYIGETGGHAVNFAAHQNDNNELEICLYEPQVQWSDDGKAQVSMCAVPLSQVSRWLFASW